MRKVLLRLTMALLVVSLLPLMAQPDSCTVDQKQYNQADFDANDFLFVDDGLLLGDSVRVNTEFELDLENLVLGLDQPFFVDYLSEGAGASHLFGFFFLDIDTDKDGIPDFWESGPNDDLDGDGLINSIDTDDDADGIPDASDTQPANVRSMPPDQFRNGVNAANNSISGAGGTPDYWQFLPNSTIQGGENDGMYEIPAVYLYIDNNDNLIPDILEYDRGSFQNKIPPYLIDKGFEATHATDASFVSNRPNTGLLGNWSYEGTIGDTVDDKFHWIGSTVFYIADDDGFSNQVGWYGDNSPYGLTYSDIYGQTNALPDYDIYGTTDIADARIPELLKNEDGTARVDARGDEVWRYRWYRSNVSGAREMVFFLVVFWGNGGADVHSYYSKSAFNPDPPPPTNWQLRNGATTGDNYGGSGFNNWFPNYRNEGDHNSLVRNRFGADFWSWIAPIVGDDTQPTVSFFGQAFFGASQEWVDEWENWTRDRRVIQYRALRDWFDQTAVDANDVINGRYGIDMTAEGDSSLIRAINGKMAHLMVGAPSRTKNAWLLGWEDLWQGGDRDFEDVVFYVKREAGGQLQSLNVADGLQDKFDDFSLSQITFTFKDNFVDSWWNIDGRFINYYYRLGNADEWIPLLGGRHLRDPDLFQEQFGGETTIESGVITRTVTIQVENKKQEIYWKVEMATENIDSVQPEVFDVIVDYQSLVHDFYYNSASLANSNINYVAAFESPEVTWEETRNRGHLYARRTFEHGAPLQLVDVVNDPELDPLVQPIDPNILWDAGVTLKSNLDSAGADSSGRTIYTYIRNNPGSAFSDVLVRKDIAQDSVDSEVLAAFDLSTERDDNILIDNYHQPEALEPDPTSAALWLQNWIHGFSNPLVVDAALVDGGPKREWVLGGINRFSPVIVRSPGIPTWFSGSDIPVSLRRSYVLFIEEDEQLNMPTRILIGTENGYIHALDAGTWIGEPETGPPNGDPGGEEIDYDWADGHYADNDYGDGSEVWSMVPGHLLDDIKFNYTGANPVTAKIDATSTVAIVLDNTNNWKRVGVFSQGFKSGTDRGRTGGVVWALDLTDIDNPVPLWERSDDRLQDQINPVSIGYLERSGGTPVFAVGYSTGGTPVENQMPAFYLVNAYTGESILSVEVGTNAALGQDVMLGSPALVDTDGNGYFDHVFGATSEGIVYAYNTMTNNLSRRAIDDTRFFLAPNVSVGADGVALVTAVSGDNPLIYDETEYPTSSFVNNVYVLTYDTVNADWTVQGEIELPTRHKAFSRPRLVGRQLVLGTTTGDTFNFCDFDEDDPGDLFLFDLNQLGTDQVVEDRIENFGSILAPITIRGGRVFAHRNTNTGGESGSGSQLSKTSALGNARGQAVQERAVTSRAVGDVYGGIGIQDGLLKLKGLSGN